MWQCLDASTLNDVACLVLSVGAASVFHLHSRCTRFNLLFSGREDVDFFAQAWSGARRGVFVGWFEVGLSRRAVLSLPRFAGSVCGSMRYAFALCFALISGFLGLFSLGSWVQFHCFSFASSLMVSLGWVVVGSFYWVGFHVDFFFLCSGGWEFRFV